MERYRSLFNFEQKKCSKLNNSIYYELLLY